MDFEDRATGTVLGDGEGGGGEFGILVGEHHLGRPEIGV